MKILMSKLFTVSGKISNQLMIHKTIKFNKLNPIFNRKNEQNLFVFSRKFLIQKTENDETQNKEITHQEITHPKKEENKDEITNEKSYKNFFEIERSSNTIKNFTPQDVEYKYVFKVKSKDRAGLNYLCNFLLNSKDENIRDYLMLIAIEVKEHYEVNKDNDEMITGLNVIINGYEGLTRNMTIEDAYPIFYLYFILKNFHIEPFKKSGNVEMLKKIKEAVISNSYGFSNSEKLILLGYLGKHIDIHDRKEIDNIIKGSIRSKISLTNLNNFILEVSFWNPDQISRITCLNLLLNHYEEISKNQLNKTNISLAADLISRIQRKFYIKYEFYYLIKNLSKAWINSRYDGNIDDLYCFMNVFKNIDRKLFISEFKIMNKFFSKQTGNYNHCVNYVEFLLELNDDELIEIRYDINSFLNLIVNEKHEISYGEYRNFKSHNFNLIILMSKSKINHELFNTIFELFYDKLMPLTSNFIEAFSKLINLSGSKKVYYENKILEYYNNENTSFLGTLDQIIILSQITPKSVENDKSIISSKLKHLCNFEIYDIYPSLKNFYLVERKYLDTEKFDLVFDNYIKSDILPFIKKEKVRSIFKTVFYLNNITSSEKKGKLLSINKWFINNYANYFLHNFYIFIYQEKEFFNEQMVKGFVDFLKIHINQEIFHSFPGNIKNLLKIFQALLIENLHKSNPNMIIIFKDLIEYMDSIDSDKIKDIKENNLIQNIFQLMCPLNIKSKLINQFLINHFEFLRSNNIPISSQQYTSFSFLIKNINEENKEIISKIVTDIDYLFNSLSPFTMESIFSIICDTNEKKIISDEKAYEMIGFIIEDSKSKRYKNRVKLLILIDRIGQELFQKYENLIIGELKVYFSNSKNVFENSFLPVFIEDLSQLKLDEIDKNSRSYKLICELLLSIYKADPKPNPSDFSFLINVLRKMNYKETPIYQEIMEKYELIFDEIKNKIFIFAFIRDLGELSPLQFDFKPSLIKINSILSSRTKYDKTKLFNSLVRINLTDKEYIEFFLDTLEENINALTQSEIYNTILSLVKLSLINKVNSKNDIYKFLKKLDVYEIRQPDNLVENHNKLNLSIIRYLPEFEMLNKITKSNIANGLIKRNELIKASDLFNLILEILKQMQCEIEIFPISKPCNIYLKQDNTALFYLDEYQRNIFNYEIPNFETEICSILCKKKQMNVLFFSEKELKDLCKKSNNSIDEVIKYFESKKISNNSSKIYDSSNFSKLISLFY